MAILDYIIIAATLVSLVIGIFRGFLRPLFDLAGVFVVLYAGGAFSALINSLLESWNWIADASVRSIVSMIVSMVLVFVIYLIVSRLILAIFKKVKLLGAINRILGGVFGVVIVYLVLSIVTAIFTSEAPLFASLKEGELGKLFQNSWVVNNVLGENVIGNGLLNSAFERLFNAVTVPTA